MIDYWVIIASRSSRSIDQLGCRSINDSNKISLAYHSVTNVTSRRTAASLHLRGHWTTDDRSSTNAGRVDGTDITADWALWLLHLKIAVFSAVGLAAVLVVERSARGTDRSTGVDAVLNGILG